MSKAAEQLRAYAERPYSEAPDTERHRLLARALSDATDEYLRLLLEISQVRTHTPLLGVIQANLNDKFIVS